MYLNVTGTLTQGENILPSLDYLKYNIVIDDHNY